MKPFSVQISEFASLWLYGRVVNVSSLQHQCSKLKHKILHVNLKPPLIYLCFDAKEPGFLKIFQKIFLKIFQKVFLWTLVASSVIFCLVLYPEHFQRKVFVCWPMNHSSIEKGFNSWDEPVLFNTYSFMSQPVPKKHNVFPFPQLHQ